MTEGREMYDEGQDVPLTVFRSEDGTQEDPNQMLEGCYDEVDGGKRSKSKPKSEFDKWIEKYNDQENVVPLDSDDYGDVRFEGGKTAKVITLISFKSTNYPFSKCSPTRLYISQKEYFLQHNYFWYLQFIKLPSNINTKLIVEYMGIVLNLPPDQNQPATPQIALFFAGKHRKVSGCLLSNHESEFHRTRSAWIFNEGLEKTKDVLNSEQCRHQSKQIGILSISALKGHTSKEAENNSANGKKSVPLISDDDLSKDEILNSKCDIFLCVDERKDQNTSDQNTIDQDIRKQKTSDQNKNGQNISDENTDDQKTNDVQKFRSSLASYLANERG